MAVTVYAGVMGSGKSYEAVQALAQALKKGRRVVTNISGLNRDKIADFIGLDPSDPLDSLVVVTDEQVRAPGFWAEEDNKTSTLVQHGDFVILDEAWNFVGVDSSLSPECKSWIRMHRHFVSSTGVASDLLVICQDVAGLHRFLKGVVDFVFVFQKLKFLGLSSKYSVTCYQGNKLRRSAVVSRQNKSYNKAIFPLYQSYATSGPVSEQNIDSRMVLWRSPRFIVALAIGPLFLLGGAYGFYTSFSGFFETPEPSAPLGSSPGPAAPPPVFEAPVAQASQPVLALALVNGAPMALVQEGESRRWVSQPINWSSPFPQSADPEAFVK